MTARRVVAGLVKDGAITRSYVGIVPKALQDLEGFYDVASNNGVLIDSVRIPNDLVEAAFDELAEALKS